MAEIISTTKDLLDDATNVPNTASDIEEEDTEVEVEQKYIIKVKDDTIDNNVVCDDGGSFKGSFKDSNTV